MNRTSIRVPAGGMYQEWMSLIDLVEEDTAKKLNEIAAQKGWREVQPKEALDMGFVEQSAPDTIAFSVRERVPTMEEKPSTPTSSSSASSSRSRKSSSYDNMRGFDPASEDDMDDNGMSRYMENNDDDGWD